MCIRDRANGYPKCCIDETVAYIYSYGYIDDRRFADNYIKMCIRDRMMILYVRI